MKKLWEISVFTDDKKYKQVTAIKIQENDVSNVQKYLDSKFDTAIERPLDQAVGIPVSKNTVIECRDWSVNPNYENEVYTKIYQFPTNNEWGNRSETKRLIAYIAQRTTTVKIINWVNIVNELNLYELYEFAEQAREQENTLTFLNEREFHKILETIGLEDRVDNTLGVIIISSGYGDVKEAFKETLVTEY